MTKTYKCNVAGRTGNQMAIEDIMVEAVNPPQAREFLKARYPGYTIYNVGNAV